MITKDVIGKMPKFWLLLPLIVVVLMISLLHNSIGYVVDLKENSITVNTIGEQIIIPTISKDIVKIRFYPQNRYSTNQYLIQDKEFMSNNVEVAKNLLLRKDPADIVYQQVVPSKQRYIHFNPFRASFQMAQGKTTYRFEMNIPDSSLEVWKDNEKLTHYTTKPPWLRLILFPFISSLSVAAFVFCLFTLISNFATSRSNHNANKRRESFIENWKFAKFLPIVILISGMLLIGFIFIKVFHAMPGFGDEMNYLIQAKIFAAGKLYVQEPSMPEFFKVDWMDIFGHDGKLWNFHPPGNSVILALGWLIGLHWITVPAVGGCILIVQFLLAKELLNRNSFALLHVFVIGTSHYFLSLASSFMAHAPSLLFLSLFYLMVIKIIKRKHEMAFIYAGVFLGIAFLIRPLSAVLSTIIPLGALFIYVIQRRLIESRYVLNGMLLCTFISSIIFFYTFFITGKLTLPYLVKGPEVGQTISVRLQKSWKLTNLYRNYNEFQNRVHSFGYLMNFSFFFVPLFMIFSNQKRSWIIVGYLSFFFYLIMYSLLHWYGWKWEPRMIYDISFIFFLLTSYGIWTVYKKIEPFTFFKVLGIVVFTLLLFYLAYTDLPNRFKTEYKNYNFSPYGVKELISKQKITNAIIFFNNKNLFAPYSPQNEITFDGDIVYAISNRQNYNYKLITKFPKKDVYYSYNGESLIKSNNFYKEDLYKIRAELEKYANENSIIIVIPWRDTVQSPLDDILPGKKVSEAEFLNLLKENSFGTTTNVMIVLVEDSTALTPIIDRFFKNITIDLNRNYDSIIQVKKLAISKQKFGKKLPGIKMTCYQGTNWDGIIRKEEITTIIDASDCFGENTSIRWQTAFSMPESRDVVFYTESDDGSAIILNDQTVLNNNLYQTHGAIQKTASAMLKKGNNYLEILYFNGPAEGFINVGVIDTTGNKQPLSITSFESFLIEPNTTQE